MRILLICLIIGAAWPNQAQERSIAAEYETRTAIGKNRSTEKWRFERTDLHVTHARSGRFERWTKLGEKEIALEQIYPGEKVIVEFAQGDLKAADVQRDWSTLFNLVSADLLAKLKATSNSKMLGYETIRYRGEINGDKWDLFWMPQIGLPARITFTSKSKRIDTKLTRFVAPSNRDELAGFTRVDYADLGDMESKPEIQKILRLDPGLSHAHKH